MKRSKFGYQLPEKLIAKYPAEVRTASRLLSLNGETGAISHGVFTDLIDKLNPGDLLVFNDTKVIPARLFGKKATGGKIELLVERLLDSRSLLAHVRSSKPPLLGTTLWLGDNYSVAATVTARRQDLFELELVDSDYEDVIAMLESLGHVPLPPYLARADETLDKDRYQTVYGKTKGAVAAPTAGLHFDESFLAQLREKGIEFAFVTLHVGAGTFQPVRTENIQDHVMHSEYLDVSAQVCDQIAQTRQLGGRVVAVGTTSVRCLETAARGSEIKPYKGDTDIFIYPGYGFKVVDALITNFHLPESTLMMLVSAFAGYNHIMRAYNVAIAENYRFFSYGDAMFMTRNPKPDLEEVLSG